MKAHRRRIIVRVAHVVAVAAALLGSTRDATAGGFTPVTFFEKQYFETFGPYAGNQMFLVRAVFEIDPAQHGGTAASLDGTAFCFQGNAPTGGLSWPPPPAERLHLVSDFCRGASGTLEFCNRTAEGRIGLIFNTCFGTIPGATTQAECLANIQSQHVGFNFKARRASQAERDSNTCTGAPTASFDASAAAAPSEVQVEDESAAITVTVTLRNTGGDALTNVAPAADPTLAGGGLADKTAGPTPASVDLAVGASASITYTYKPTKGGPVKFSFESFGAQSSGGPIEVAGPVETNQVLIKEDVNIEVKLEPTTLTTDSRATSGGIVRIKVTNGQGEPSVGRRVRLKFPQYFLGPVDFEPRVLICPSDGSLAYPPGANPVPLDAAFATTPDSGEVTLQLWVGTQRRSAELLVTADAIEGNGDLLATDSDRFALADSGGALTSSILTKLNEAQTGQLPEAQRLDEAGITGRGAPLEVLQSVVRWLGIERERGVPYLEGVDFVPITSQDQTSAGVLFYPRGELQAVITRLQGTVTSVTAFVLQIEVGQLDPSGRHRVVWVTDFGGMMPLETWVTTRPLNGFGIEDQGKPVRGQPVPAVTLVSSSEYAYLGFPYPTAGSPAAGSYGGGCVPSLNGVTAALHSPVSLLVKNGAGNALGHDAAGAYLNDVPGAVYGAGEPALYLLPPGGYQAALLGTGTGPATLVLSSPALVKAFTMKVKAGKTGTVTFDDSLAGASGTFNRKRLKVADGVPITVTGVKKKVKVHSGDPLTLTVTNPFGAPVAGARVRVTGNAFDAETLTGADGVATMPLVATKATKKLTVTIDGAGVQPKTLKLKVKLLK